jgi:HAD superfamily phosphoserine phosphatase-like hydrolase
MTEGTQLAIFDFDKTLVSRDSFRLFGELGARSGLEKLLLFGFAVMCRFGAIDNCRYKELVLGRVWLGRSPDEREALRDKLSAAMTSLTIEPAMAKLRKHLSEGHEVAIFSASPEWYLRPFVHAISAEIEVFGSLIEERPEGGVRVENLFRERKAEKARKFVERRTPSKTWVYTDHRDDLELMRLGDRITLVRPKQSTIDAVRAAGIEFEVIAS